MGVSTRMTQTMLAPCLIKSRSSTKGKIWSRIRFSLIQLFITIRYEDRSYADKLSRADFWQLAAIKAIEVGLANANKATDCGEEVCQGLVREKLKKVFLSIFKNFRMLAGFEY